MTTIKQLCEHIIAGYAADKSGFDPDMGPLILELGDRAQEILDVLTSPVLTAEHVAEISRLASVWGTRRVRAHATQMGYGGVNETEAGTQAAKHTANTAFHEYLRGLTEERTNR